MQNNLEKSLSVPSSTKAATSSPTLSKEAKKDSSAVASSAFSTTHLLPSGLTQIDTPNDHNCLFWSAALALLVPLLGESEADKARFKAMYALLFGTTGTVTLQGSKGSASASLVINADTTQEAIRQALKTYNFSKQDPLNFVGNPLYALIAEKFRYRVVGKLWEVFPTQGERADIAAEYGGNWDKYIEKMRTASSSWGWGGEPEIRAIGALVEVNIIVYGKGKGYPKNYMFAGAGQSLCLAHVSADSQHSTVKNHYNYGVEDSVYQAHLQNLRAGPSFSTVPVADKKKVVEDDDKAQKDEKKSSASTASPDQFPKTEGIALRELLRLERKLKLNPKDASLWNQKGNLLSDLEYYKEALEAFETASEINPKDSVYVHNKGATLYDLERYEEALAAYEAALKINPKESAYVNRKGNTLYDLKRYEEALAAYEAALKIKPKCVPYQKNKALALEKLGRYQDALNVYDAILKVSSGNVARGCLDNKIRVLNILGRYEDAKAVTKIVPKSESRHSISKKANAHYDQGLKFAEIGQYEKALQKYDAALQIKPTASCLNSKGYLLYELGRHEEALIAYEEALKIDEKHLYALANKGDVLQKLGQADKAREAYEAAFFLSSKAKKKDQRVPKAASLVGLGRYEEALTYLEPLLKQAPADNYILLVKGRALQGLGRKEEATAYFELARKPQLVYQSIDLAKKGDDLLELGKYEEALAAYEAALKIYPDTFNCLFGKAYALGELKRYEASFLAYEAALKIQPRNGAAIHNKGYMLYKLERYQEALTAYDTVLKIDPKDTVTLNNKGDALTQLKRYEEAFVAYEACLKIKPKDSAFLNNKGDVLKELGRYGESLAAYEAALQLQPGNSAYLNKKAQILQKLGREAEALDCLEKVKEAKMDFTMPSRSEPTEITISTTENRENTILVTTAKLSHFRPLLRLRSSGRKRRPVYKLTVSDPDVQGKPRYKSELGRWLLKANDLSDTGRYEEALAVYEDMLAIAAKGSSHYKEILYHKSKVLYELARYEEALIIYDELVKMGSIGKKTTLLFCLAGKGITLERLGRYEEALAVYEGLSKVCPRDHLYKGSIYEHYLKSSVLNKLGRYEEALAACEMALKYNSGDSCSRIDCLNNKGVTLENLGRYQEALAVYTKALEQEQESREWWRKKGRGEPEPAVILCFSNRGDVLYKLGYYEEALVDYEAALQFQPENVAYLHKKTQILQKLEKTKKSGAVVREFKGDIPDLEGDKVPSLMTPASTSRIAAPFLSPNPLAGDKEQKHTGKRKSYGASVDMPKLSHPIMPKEWETYLKRIRTTEKGGVSTAKNNCSELLETLMRGTEQDDFETAPSRPSRETYHFHARTVERTYGKTQQKTYLALEDAFTSYLGSGLHRGLEPPHQSLVDLRDDDAPKESKLIAADTLEQEGFEPIKVTRVDLEARLQKLARENGGWALIGMGFSRLLPLSDNLGDRREEAEQQLLKTPGHFCGVYVVTPEFNAEHGNKLKEDNPSGLITFLEPQAIYPRTKEKCIAHKLEELFNIATEDQEILDGDVFDYHFSLLVLNSHHKMEARAKHKRLKEEQSMISSASQTSEIKMTILPHQENRQAFPSSTQAITSLLRRPAAPPERLASISPRFPLLVPMDTDEKNTLSPASAEESKRLVSVPSTTPMRFLSGTNVKPEATTSVQSLQILKETLQELCQEKGYTFTCARLKNNQLQLAFTGFETISTFAKKVDIQKQLAKLTRSLQQCMVDNGISLEREAFKANFKTWTLTIEAEPNILHQLEQLLQTAGLVTVTDMEEEAEICRMQ